MARFAVGDKVRVTNDTEGQPIDLIDAVGIVSSVDGFLKHGTVGDSRPGEQLYRVYFDGIGFREGLWESWLLSIESIETGVRRACETPPLLVVPGGSLVA